MTTLPIMKRWLLILVANVVLFTSILKADDDDRFLYRSLSFRKIEVQTYTFTSYTPHVKLEMEYARDEILNQEKWLNISHKVEAYEIDLVFTLYPKEIEEWRTDYYELLNGRMEELFQIDSSLNNRNIKWNMILQTHPKNEEEAKEFFHGFVIKFRPRKVRVVQEVKTPQQLKALISGYATFPDSTVMKVMDRNHSWKNMLVVMDWTGSMYKFGAQLVLWHKLNMVNNHSTVKHFVFFNDGNHKKSWQKKIGKTGGVYRTKSDEMDEIVETMLYVMKKGNGGDRPENDLEALLTGLQYLDGFDEVILIADNKSGVRDIELLENIDKPVHIIICDVDGEVHPHYIEIAARTGGSIHTLQEDMVMP